MTSSGSQGRLPPLERSRTLVGYRRSCLGRDHHYGIDAGKRCQHVLLTGPTGAGKTTTMTTAAYQDAHAGRGFAMLVQKGQAIDDLLAVIPQSRHDDIIYLNPAETVPALNVLEPVGTSLSLAQEDHQIDIIVGMLLATLKRYSESWGDRFPQVLEAIIRGQLEQNFQKGARATLLDVYNCVVNPDQLSVLIDSVTEPVVREELVSVKEDLSMVQLEPVRRRLNHFLMKRPLREALSRPTSSLDFRALLDEEQILLVDLQRGDLGSRVAEAFGSLILLKLWTAAQSRIDQPLDKRTPYYLYLDELQHYVVDSTLLSTLLNEAREYRLGCCVATQSLSNLATADLREAVVTNCRSKLLFAPEGAQAANHISGLVSGVDTTTLAHLDEYQALFQTPGGEIGRSTTIITTYPPIVGDPTQATRLKQQHLVSGDAHLQSKLETTIGRAANAGGPTHDALLEQAEVELEAAGAEVILAHQGPGEAKPDGWVTYPGGSKAHLEVEAATLTKPAKVLRNYRRAIDTGLACQFVVASGNGDRLRSILEDPVNRQGGAHEDERGTFDYYQDEHGAVRDLAVLAEGQYDILEVDLTEALKTATADVDDCPELDAFSMDELQTFCRYRTTADDCRLLGTQCVLLEDE